MSHETLGETQDRTIPPEVWPDRGQAFHVFMLAVASITIEALRRDIPTPEVVRLLHEQVAELETALGAPTETTN